MLSTTPKDILNRFDEIKLYYNSIKDDATSWVETWHYEGEWNFIPVRFNYESRYNLELPDDIVIAGFSIINPGTEIHPHKGYEGYSKHITRYHMTLYASEDSYLKVGKSMYEYIEKTLIPFNDAEEHSAWNRGTKPRVSFLFDVEKNGKVEMTQKMIDRFK